MSDSVKWNIPVAMLQYHNNHNLNKEKQTWRPRRSTLGLSHELTVAHHSAWSREKGHFCMSVFKYIQSPENRADGCLFTETTINLGCKSERQHLEKTTLQNNMYGWCLYDEGNSDTKHLKWVRLKRHGCFLHFITVFCFLFFFIFYFFSFDCECSVAGKEFPLVN